MEFALYISDITLLEHLDETLESVDISNIPDFVNEVFFTGHPNGLEYLANLISLNQLEKGIGEETWEIHRLYFGQEFCQELIPELEVVKTAYFFSRQFGWAFTYVTPGAVTDAGIDCIREHLAFLASETPGTEIVINNWGLLHILPEEYPSLTPVLGRLLVKQKRIPRYANGALPRNMKGIETDAKTIGENQSRALQGVNLSVPVYRNALHQRGVARVDLDVVPQGTDLSPSWGFDVSCYYPWSYVTGGRNCLTAAGQRPSREHIVDEKPCPQPCRKENATSVLKDPGPGVLERGNSVFSMNHAFMAPYLSETSPVNRLVYTPYIPL